MGKTSFYRVIGIITLLVYGTICFLSYQSFRNTESILYAEDRARREMTENSVYHAVRNVENTSRIIDAYFAEEMKRFSEYLIAEYEKNPDIMSWDLDRLKKEGGGFEIYIIDENLTVRRTTFPPDQGLDFKKFKNFKTLLEKRLQGNSFVTDFIELSSQTGRMMKYSYMPSPDHRYLFELSIDVEKEFPGLNIDLSRVIRGLLEKNPEVKDINIYKFNQEGRPVLEISHNLRSRQFVIPPSHMEVIKDAVLYNEAREIKDKEQVLTYRYIPYNTYLASGEIDWWNSYLIEIVYDNRSLMQKIGRQRGLLVSNLVLITGVFGFLAFIIAYYLGKLEKMSRQLAIVIDRTSEGYLMIDLDYNIKDVNRALCEMLGYKKEELLNYNVKALLQDEGLDYERFLQGLDNNLHYTHEAVLPSKNGEMVNVVVKATLVRDKNNRPLYAFAFVSNITERKKMEERLRFMSLHDSLTGLYNRAFFEQKMASLTPDDYPLGIIVFDVDGLKLINDTLGHKKGDELLIEAASAIKKSCGERENMVLARIGGDEFAVLAWQVRREELEEVVLRLKQEVENYNQRAEELVLSVSTGFAWAEAPVKSAEDIFKEADNNMYREKLYQRQSVRSALINTLKKAMQERDLITEGHSERMQDLVGDFARYLGLPEEKINEMRLLAQFHDIGKVGIPDSILFKEGELTLEEKREMEKHCEVGCRIASASPDLLPVADFILKHHEWWNGEGYPLGLKGEEIPLECRILSICDTYDALTNNRPYRNGVLKQQALELIKQRAGIQFDPFLVEKFVEYVEKKEKG